MFRQKLKKNTKMKCFQIQLFIFNNSFSDEMLKIVMITQAGTLRVRRNGRPCQTQANHLY